MGASVMTASVTTHAPDVTPFEPAGLYALAKVPEKAPSTTSEYGCGDAWAYTWPADTAMDTRPAARLGMRTCANQVAAALCIAFEIERGICAMTGRLGLSNTSSNSCS